MAAAGAVLGVALAAWPIFTLAVLGAVALAVAASRSPEYAFVVAVLLFSTEGWWKAMLSYYGTPLPVSGSVVGAALLDGCLLLSAAWLARSGGLLRLGEFWRRSSRTTRMALTLLMAWLVVSVVQTLFLGDLVEAAHGFRLVQGYVLLCLGGAVLLPRAFHGRALSLVLAGGLAASVFALVAFVLGPPSVLRGHTLNEAGIETYGGIVRAAGTFSASMGLATFLAPVAVLALAAALSGTRDRLLAASSAAAASGAVVLAFVRSGVVAIAVGFVVTAWLAATAVRGESRSRRWRIVWSSAAGVAVLAVGTGLASRMSADVKTRTEGLVRPLEDESVRLRLKTWRETLRIVAAHPLGTGVGSVGAASVHSAPEPSGPTAGTDGTTIADNSYLKILREQGVAGILLLLGLGAALVALVHGLRMQRDASPAAIASFAGAATFLVLAAATEAIEQPGKVLAWTLLGVALAGIGTQGVESPANAREQARAPRKMLARTSSRASAYLALVVAAVVTTFALTAARDGSFTTQLMLETKTPAEAQQLAAGTRRAVVGPAALQVVTRADALLALGDLPARVRTERVGSAVRLMVRGATPRESVRLARQLVDVLSGGTIDFTIGKREPARVRSIVDRALAMLPGSFPARVLPAWSPVLAGAAVMLLLLALCSRPRRGTLGRCERERIRCPVEPGSWEGR